MLNSFPRGDTKLVKLRIRDANDLPVNITGWILYISFKLVPTSVDTGTGNISVKINLATADPQGLKYRDLSAVNGSVTLRLGPELTSTLVAGQNYYYDIQRVVTILDGSNLVGHDVWTLVSNRVKVTDDVTLNYSQGTLGVPIP